MKLMLKYSKSYIWLIVFCLVTKTLGAFAELFIPEMLALMIDEAIPLGKLDYVLLLGGIMLLLSLLTLILNIVANRTSAKAAGAIARDIRRDLFDKTVSLDASELDLYGTSGLTNRLTTDTYNVSSFFARLIRAGVRAPLLTIGGVIVTLFIDWRLSLVLIGLLPLVFCAVYFITKKSIPIYSRQQATLDSVIRNVDETARGIKVIKALSKEDAEREDFISRSEELSRLEIKAGSVISLTKPLTDLILNIGLCLIILLGYILARYFGFNATGKLLAFMTYFTIILNSMLMISRLFVQLSRAESSSRRIAEVLQDERRMTICEPQAAPHGGELIFSNVSFSYRGLRDNLSNISFTARRGTTLGIIGPTGSGKSTLISLVLRHYDPTSGSIYIGGQSLSSIPKAALTEMLGVVFQNDFIPRGTVRDAIAFSRRCTDDEIFSALKVAEGYDFVSRLPGGLDYELSSGATNLSGGQRQRLLIARAVLKSPDILILDDSSSALDFATDRRLRENLAKVKRRLTIIIAERISSIRHADKIIMLEGGKIVADGTHEELTKSSEKYRALAEIQSFTEANGGGEAHA